MSTINGNLKTLIAIGGFLLSATGVIYGYGKLNEKVDANKDNIAEVRFDLQRIAQDPDASASGAQLRGEIKVLSAQLADIKQQLNRIEQNQRRQ